MTQFTKDFIKGSIIWGILFGIAYVYLLGKYMESQALEMAKTYDISMLYTFMIVSVVAASLFGLFVAWFVIGRVLKGGCIDVPANFNKWLRNYAIIMILFMSAVTVYNIYDYGDRAKRLESSLAEMSNYSNNALRMLQDLRDFLDNYVLYEFITLVICTVIMVATLPILKKKFENS